MTRPILILIAVWLLVLSSAGGALWARNTPPPTPMVDKSQPILAPSPFDTGASWTAAVDTPQYTEPERERPRSTERRTTERRTTERRKTDTLIVQMLDAEPYRRIELTCPNGYRERMSLKSGRATFRKVPTEPCTLFFKGAAPARYGPVSSGQNLKCRVQGTTGLCT